MTRHAASAPLSVAGLVGGIGRLAVRALLGLGGLGLLVGRALASAGRRPVRVRGYIYQLLQIGDRSLPLALLIAISGGMVLAFQFGFGLSRFGAKLYVGQITVTALFRELGPTLTALVVGGRVSAGIAAELGVMSVTEQIDAARALGADPLQRLVAPRLVAAVLVMPLLTILADVVGGLGAMAIAVLQFDVSSQLFLRGAYEFVTIGDFLSGLIKALVFGFLIGSVSCQQGLGARGGTEGVGRATTRAVVAGSVSVLVSDFFLTKLLVSL
jgi:phospholipid/cholesterol/gamma-HCH transport system permease protein